MTTDSEMEEIRRIGVTARSSLATSYAGIGHFAVTPKAPYDGSLSAAEQMQQLLEKADARLREIGSSRERLLMVTLVLADIADRDEINVVWDAFFEGIAPPARACHAGDLATPSLKVEAIMVCAC